MSDYKFLYWDDPGDSQEDVDNQEAIKRMEIIMRNGNSGVHYDIYEDDEDTDS